MKPKKVKPLDAMRRSVIFGALRKASRFWPPSIAALGLAEVPGSKPKRFKCASCSKEFERSEVHRDHKNPVVDPVSGFTTWDNYIGRLLCDKDGYQILCIACHDTKTQTENKQRRKEKKSGK
jgi:hypothetical protein